MMTVSDLPDDVLEHLRSIFRACNARTTEKLSNNPNAPEESLPFVVIVSPTGELAGASTARTW